MSSHRCWLCHFSIFFSMLTTLEDQVHQCDPQSNNPLNMNNEIQFFIRLDILCGYSLAPILFLKFNLFLTDWSIKKNLILIYIFQLCTPRVSPSSPEEHYRAVCRALATESIELRVFLSKVFTNDTEALRLKADAESSRQELAKLDFRDWVSVTWYFIDISHNVRMECECWTF